MPNLQELALRNGGDFPDLHVIEVITRISDLHSDIVAMPDFGSLLDANPTVYTAADGTEVQTDATVVAITDYLKTIQTRG